MGLNSLQLHDGGYLSAGNVNAYSFGTNDFTVEAWVKTLTGGTLVGKKSTAGGAGNGGFLLVARPDGTIKFATDNGFGFFELDTVPSAVCDGVWHHVAAVRQGGSISIYLDAHQLSGVPRGNATPPLNVNSSYRLTIGTVDQQQEPYRNFNGCMAEVRLWSRARTQQEISAAYGRRLAPGTAALVGYWPAEMGLTLDFSATRNATQIANSVTPTTDAPAVGQGKVSPMLFLFSGVYDTSTKPTIGAGSWTASGIVYVTSMGYVVQNNQMIVNAVIKGNAITWPMQGNPSSGNITFLLSSSDTRFWPQGPQSKYDFQGSCQFSGSASVDYRGVITPRKLGCGLIFNIGSEQVLYTPNPVPGAQVTLVAKTAEIDEHFCVYDDNHILEMHSGLALSVQGNLAAGSPIVLAIPIGDQAAQGWLFGRDGLIRLSAGSNLAITVDPSQSPQRLILANVNTADSKQRFVTLSNSQFVWNGVKPNVLSAVATPSGYDRVAARPKATNAAELWYLSQKCFVNSINARALAVSGSAAPGATLVLLPFNPADSAQGFTVDHGQLKHIASGLPVKMSAAGGAIILGAAGETGSALNWIIAPNEPAGQPQMQVRALAMAAEDGSLTGSVSYIIRIHTGDYIAAGTDDKVEISLFGDHLSSAYVELNHSETHSDPFERGNTDQFTVQLPSVGKILGVNMRYGANNWFWNDRWVVDWITVYDPTVVTHYLSDTLGNGAQYEMPSQTYIPLPSAWVGGGDSTMAVGKAPTQDQVTRGWFDHTWAVTADEQRTTFFDSGGGHGGAGAVDNIISTKCSLNTAVKMATGYYIDQQHPYQSVYGHDDVEGKQTCGVRASGFRAWDGQCHQIVNRLLYICNPMRSLDDVPSGKRPTGYGLSVLMFGRYGVEFPVWCGLNGFPTPREDSSSLFDFVRRTVSDERHAIAIAYQAIALQGATENDPQNPHGPALHDFFRQVKIEGVSNSTMSALVDLPEDKIVEEQQP